MRGATQLSPHFAKYTFNSNTMNKRSKSFVKNNFDETIIALLQERSETAFLQIEKHYGALCRKIA